MKHRGYALVCRFTLAAAGILLHVTAGPAGAAAQEGSPPDTLGAGAPTISDTTVAGVRSRASVPLLPEAELLARASVHALTAPVRWKEREWALAVGSVTGVALVSLLDEAGRDLMARNRTARNTELELLIEPFGAERSLQILGGMLAVGVLAGDEKLRATATEGLAAGLVAAGILAPAMQKAIGRPKPRGGLPAHTFRPFSGHHSLPSGHATQAFAVASVIATEYDHPAVRVGAYGMAAAVGVSRMYRRSHFVSDVVGAAILGTAVGRTAARYGRARRGTLSVTPVIASSGEAWLVLHHPL